VKPWLCSSAWPLSDCPTHVSYYKTRTRCRSISVLLVTAPGSEAYRAQLKLTRRWPHVRPRHVYTGEGQDRGGGRPIYQHFGNRVSRRNTKASHRKVQLSRSNPPPPPSWAMWPFSNCEAFSGDGIRGPYYSLISSGCWTPDQVVLHI
jgi:hypothetical protein